MALAVVESTFDEIEMPDPDPVLGSSSTAMADVETVTVVIVPPVLTMPKETVDVYVVIASDEVLVAVLFTGGNTLIV